MDILAIYIGEGYRRLKEFPTADFGPYIWECLSQRWLQHSADAYLYTPKEDQLWNLWKKPSIPFHHRAVLMMTFGGAYIVKNDGTRARIDLEAFLKDFPAGRSVQHTWDGIRDVIARAQYPALGFHISPLTENPFEGKWNRGTQQYEPFEWCTVYDMYAMLSGVTHITRGITQAQRQEFVGDTRE